MVEVNPWTSDEDLKAALMYRGALIASWAQIEVTFKELAVRASFVPEYRGLRDKAPSTQAELTLYLREVFAAPGPLRRHQPLAVKVLARFEKAAGLRNTMAHSRMRILEGWGVTLESIRVSRSGKITHLVERHSLEAMASLATQATRFSRRLVGMMAALDARGVVPSLQSSTGAANRAR